MATVRQITAPAQLTSLLSSSRVVVVNFYSDSSSGAVSALYEQLARQLSRDGVVTFSKVNAEQQPHIAQSYNITNLPTFIIFKNGNQVSRTVGAKPEDLSEAVKRLAAEADSDGSAGGFGEASSSSGGTWLGAGLPRGYGDVTEQVDVRGLDLLNSDSDFGGVRTLFEKTAPASITKAKGAASSSGSKDWVESDVDEQLMLYVPFTATLKIHTIHLTSCSPESEDDDEVPMRPKTIRLYINRQHNLGFEEADDIPATQTIELQRSDWDERTGTAKLELRFVKFQNVYSLVLFVENGDGDGEKTRVDRIRIIGDAGEKRDPGQLKKLDDDS